MIPRKMQGPTDAAREVTMLNARKLTFPVGFADIIGNLLELNVSREVAAERLGPPILTDWVEGLGTADFWAFEYPCGLQVAFEFLHNAGSGRVIADSPEVDHILRHIPFSEPECVWLSGAAFQSALEFVLKRRPERQHEFDSLRSFQVWRQGEDGNPFPIGDPTSERDANCRVKQFEASAHKQLYWYSRTAQM